MECFFGFPLAPDELRLYNCTFLPLCVWIRITRFHGASRGSEFRQCFWRNRTSEPIDIHGVHIYIYMCVYTRCNINMFALCNSHNTIYIYICMYVCNMNISYIYIYIWIYNIIEYYIYIRMVSPKIFVEHRPLRDWWIRSSNPSALWPFSRITSPGTTGEATWEMPKTWEIP